MDISNYEERLEELSKLENDNYLTEDQQDEFDLLNTVHTMVLRGNDIDALQAWLDLDHNDFDDFEEAYQGCYGDDEDFAQELCEDLGEVPRDFPSYIHIDWERTANDLMQDYEESNGYYFRIL
jgi:hypothetical protein